MYLYCSVTKSCPTLSNPMDCSLPGSSVHGIFQARVLESGATAFSDLSRYMGPFHTVGFPCVISGGLNVKVFIDSLRPH